MQHKNYCNQYQTLSLFPDMHHGICLVCKQSLRRAQAVTAGSTGRGFHWPVDAPMQVWPIAIKTSGDRFSAGLQLRNKARDRWLLCLCSVPSSQSEYVGRNLRAYIAVLHFPLLRADPLCCSSLTRRRKTAAC